MADSKAKGANRRILTVEFGDCDPARIVYYPNFFRWFDQGTHHLFAEAGFPLPALATEHGLTIPLVGARGDFTGPAVWGDRIAIDSRVTRWGGKSFDVTHTVIHAETGADVADGQETRVCVAIDPDDPKGIRGVAIPDDIKKALGG